MKEVTNKLEETKHKGAGAAIVLDWVKAQLDARDQGHKVVAFTVQDTDELSGSLHMQTIRRGMKSKKRVLSVSDA